MEQILVNGKKVNLAYKGNPLLRPSNIQRPWTQAEIEEIKKCKDDPVYFGKKYVKIVHVDKGLVPFEMWEFQEELINTCKDNRFVIAKWPRQQGKALALNTPIYTTRGWKDFGDLKVGDRVYGDDGLPTRVTFVTETMHNHKCFEITFDDGDPIIADAEHLWQVHSDTWGGGSKILMTEEIVKLLNAGFDFWIHLAKPIKFNIKSNAHSGAKYNRNIKKRKGVEDWFQNSLMRAGIALKERVLKQNMKRDEDGSLVEYRDTPEVLEKIRFIAATSGLKSKIEEVGDKFKITINTKKNRTVIKSIKEVESVPVRCITVDNKNHMFLVGKDFIPTHNSTTVVTYLLWYILFHRNVNVAILSNKSAGARVTMSRLQIAYMYLPDFLKQGIKNWNKSAVEFENGSKIKADSTTASSIRGDSVNIVMLDEFAHIPNNIADEFFTSIYPTISSGKTTKIIIVSTPKGMNKFYDLWTEAENGKNDYVTHEAFWWQVPGRDEKWKEETIRNTDLDQFNQEFNTNFLGSTNTLISAEYLKVLKERVEEPKTTAENGQIKIYEYPMQGRNYAITVDVSEGMNKDYSAFSVIDVSNIPFKQVATFHSSTIDQLVLPTIVHQVGKKYNNAHVLVEINGPGLQTAEILHSDLGYDNIIRIESRGRSGQYVASGYRKKTAPGIKQSVATKRIGCTNLKSIVENGKLIIPDKTTVMELFSFNAENNGFKADEGKNDDMALTLVLFGWLAAQKYFKENIQQDIRRSLQEDQLNVYDEDILSWGVFDNGINTDTQVDKSGDIWVDASVWSTNPFYSNPFQDSTWDY